MNIPSMYAGVQGSEANEYFDFDFAPSQLQFPGMGAAVNKAIKTRASGEILPDCVSHPLLLEGMLGRLD
jgi:hypothetical protein